MMGYAILPSSPSKLMFYLISSIRRNMNFKIKSIVPVSINYWGPQSQASAKFYEYEDNSADNIKVLDAVKIASS
jgi:hypothetical protein